jgi:hypothetical protein
LALPLIRANGEIFTPLSFSHQTPVFYGTRALFANMSLVNRKRFTFNSIYVSPFRKSLFVLCKLLRGILS